MNVPFFVSGDWPFFFSEQIKLWSWTPSAYWVWSNFGENATARLWLDYPFRLIVKLLAIPWVIMEKLFLFFVIFLAFWSVYKLSGRFFREQWQRFVSGFIYIGNTYFFLCLGGGQLGVAAAYAIFPYVLFRFLNLFDKPSLRTALKTGIFFAALVALDLRIAYVAVIALVLYNIFVLKKLLSFLKYLCIAFGVALSLHLYWILPAVVWGMPMPESATGTSSLSFFSVADFSHALTLLHPNWPENLFGRVYFQQPEFMLLPILAFASLLFIKKREVLFFPLLALMGIFLAKGVNPPGGGVYEFLFKYIPGFVMFRDPTKFFVFISLGYSILIPITLEGIVRFGFIRRPPAVLQGDTLRNCVIGMLLLLELFLLRDVFLGKTTHSFQFQPIPKEYELLKNMLRSDTRFSRVLWLPNVPHFAYSDNLHPFVDAVHVPGPYTQEVLSDKSIGYIVVPTDEGKNMFLTDYKPDPSMRQTIIYKMEDSGYPRMGEFADLAVFKNLKAADLFKKEDGSSVLWKQAGVNSYTIIDPPEMLVMHVAFDSGWKVKANDTIISGQETEDGWIQFTLPVGLKEVRVYFAPDAAAKTGALISGLLLLVYVILWMH